jgi:UDP-3-O-[3-hydroxymyristoyl] glucosamine N-acyltransferase
VNLSEFFDKGEIVLDGGFSTLGYVDSGVAGSLAYCDTVFYVEKANENRNITCVITKKDLSIRVGSKKGICVSKDPRVAFYKLHNLLLEKGGYRLQLDHKVGRGCSVHPSAIISLNTRIGNYVTIAENVVIKDGVTIGDDTFIDAGAVVGCDGLLYTVEDERVCFVRHAGGVSIGNNVVILSSAVIARSVHGSLLTTIGDNAIIGVSTKIGHEAQIGNNVVISTNCVIARRARIGEGTRIGPSSVVREHVTIGESARVHLGSTVVEDVGRGQSVSGNFALDHKLNLMNYTEMKRPNK